MLSLLPAARYNTATRPEKAATAVSTSERIQQALQLLQQAREESEQGEYAQASGFPRTQPIDG